MIAMIRDKYLIRSKGLSSVTELNRFDEAEEATLRKGKNLILYVGKARIEICRLLTGLMTD